MYPTATILESYRTSGLAAATYKTLCLLLIAELTLIQSYNNAHFCLIYFRSIVHFLAIDYCYY